MLKHAVIAQVHKNTVKLTLCFHYLLISINYINQENKKKILQLSAIASVRSLKVFLEKSRTVIFTDNSVQIICWFYIQWVWD